MLYCPEAVAPRGRGALGILALVEHPKGVLVVVENPAYAAGLAAMAEEEVFIAPGLEHLVVGRVDAVAGVLEAAVEMLGIAEEGVVGGEVGTAAKPPHRPRLEVAVVEVNGGDVRVARVQHHRSAGGKPAVALGLWPLAEDRGRQFAALHLGEVHPALFEDSPALHHPRAAAAPLRPHPALLGKIALPVKFSQA